MKMKVVEYSNSEIARKLGVTEGTIRYRIKRRLSGREDGRRLKRSLLERFRGVIEEWAKGYEDDRRRPTLKTLYAWLRRDQGYEGSYDAFRRYIRKACPQFHKKRAWVRVETPPGALSFVDWKEDVWVQMARAGNWVKVQALCFALGFSRKMVVRFSEKKDLEAFIHGHQEAFRVFGGLPRVVRTDCLKSAILRWQGQDSVLNESYRRYMHGLGVEVFPGRPGAPEDKGKMEKRIRDLFSRLDFRHRVFGDLAELQAQTDGLLTDLERQWRCGATGLSVAESFGYEKTHLRPLPSVFPVLPLKETRTRVRRDGTVYFDGNYYQVPGVFRDRSVLCVNTGQEIVVWHEGEVVERFAYLPGTRGMVRLSEQALEAPEVTLSAVVRRWGLEVARRQVEIYQEIIRRREA
ncbi:MAG: IS21 family transposase [Candidatus Bathyarchaeota archaeon]|nr:IS21 family transposase [Candidatus Bathyarchaeota archaeon]